MLVDYLSTQADAQCVIINLCDDCIREMITVHDTDQCSGMKVFFS
jgi:hypothetical protein